jgi:hypothetical protein
MLSLIHKDDTLLVVQQEPTCYTTPFSYYLATSNQSKHRHYLAYPYIQFTLRASKHKRYAGLVDGNRKLYSFHATVSNEPIKSIQDTVYLPPIMHAFDDGAFCLGQKSFKETDRIKLLQQCIRIVWGSVGSYDRMFVGHQVVEQCLGSLNKWEKLTKEDPKKILETKWIYPFKLAELPCRVCQVTSAPDVYDDTEKKYY